MLERRSKMAAAIKADNGFDAVVIGGGVNGIGVFRDLSLQGLRVLLVEKNDFCSGCSAAPSRMIHGGLRYLENGEFGLVKESLQERDALLTNAPHMVQPLPTVIPITSLFSGLFNAASTFLGMVGKPAARGLMPIKVGLSLYDIVTRKRRKLPKHEVSMGKATRARWPHLNNETKYSAIYYDAWISHPERLCIELLRDTEEAAPQSLAVNHAMLRKEGEAYLLTDGLTGDEFEIAPKTIVNASGAWLDDVTQSLKGGEKIEMVSGTKGSHLILDNPELFAFLDGHMVFFENADGRVCIVFPYLGRVLAGSTDIRVDKAGRVKCEPEEQAYILESLNLVFDGIEISEQDIVFSYSGIRPLPKSNADFTGRISRGHDIRKLDGDVPQFCMIGGKWTTFRAFGEQAADVVLEELGETRQVSTLNRPIGGGDGYPEAAETLEKELVLDFGVSWARAEHLVSHYGTYSKVVQAACNASGNDDAVLGTGTEYTAAEIAFLFNTEYAASVSDVILRRTSLAIRGVLDGPILDRVTEIIRDLKSLSTEDAMAERQALVDELVQFHGADKEMLESKTENWRIECE